VDGAVAVAVAWDDVDSSRIAQRAAQLVGIVAVVAKQVAHAPGAFEEGGCRLHVANVAGGQHQRISYTEQAEERMTG
jgi:hypothetical protein